MQVGVCKLQLRLPENESLKGKRHVVKSLVDRVRNRFNVSIAEVEDQDQWRLITLGVGCVSNDGQYINEVLSKVVDYVADTRGDAEVLDYEIEILPSL